jgi:hypothetical protein
MKISEGGISDLAGALAKAQGEFTAAERDHMAKVTSKKGEQSSYSYAYADLQAYLEVCRKPLADNGLSFIQNVGVDGQKATVSTLLIHASGQWLESDPLSLVASDHLPQSIGSAITYARRYSLSAVLGMASEADDDANGAQGNYADTGRKESNLPMCPQCQTNKSVIVGKAEYGGGFVCFAKKGGCGTKWQADGETDIDKKSVTDPDVMAAIAAEDATIADILGQICTHTGYEAPLKTLYDQTIAPTYKQGSPRLKQAIIDKVKPAYEAALPESARQPTNAA